MSDSVPRGKLTERDPVENAIFLANAAEAHPQAGSGHDGPDRIVAAARPQRLRAEPQQESF